MLAKIQGRAEKIQGCAPLDFALIYALLWALMACVQAKREDGFGMGNTGIQRTVDLQWWDPLVEEWKVSARSVFINEISRIPCHSAYARYYRTSLWVTAQVVKISRITPECSHDYWRFSKNRRWAFPTNKLQTLFHACAVCHRFRAVTRSVCGMTWNTGYGKPVRICSVSRSDREKTKEKPK